MPYGVSPQMVEAWGQAIFDLSLNKQVRRGDPIRKLDHAAWSGQRAATGLSDDEIAARIGLARPQVTFIRNVLERRVFRTNQYRKLYRLGGGRRWRPDDYVDPEEAYAVGPEAALLRQSLAFDRERVADWVGAGAWTAETLWNRIEAAAGTRPEETAMRVANRSRSWGELHDQAERMARGLAARGVGRGEAVALDLSTNDAVPVMAAVWRLGGVVLPLPPGLTEAAAADLLNRGRVRALVFDPARPGFGAEGAARLAGMLPSLTLCVGSESGGGHGALADLDGAGGRGPALPVGGDPALLFAAKGRLVPHTHQTLLAGARAVLGDDTPAQIRWTGDGHGPGFAAALGAWLAVGATLALGEGASASDSAELQLAAAGAPLADGIAPVEATRGGAVRRLALGGETQALLVSAEGGTGWRALPGVELREGEGGEIEARGPAMAPAYVDEPSATAARFRPDGWVRTGLAGMIGEDGSTVELAPTR